MSLSAARMHALVVKDFAIHGRDILLTQVGLLVLIALMTSLKPSDPAVEASAVFNFNFLLAAFWSEWLVSREKVKGTFSWLRACPVDDRELVAGKFTSVALCTVPLWAVSSVIFTGEYWFPARWSAWVVLLLVLLAFGALAVATRWRFGQKLGQMLPFLLVGVVIAVFVILARHGQTLPVDPEILLRSRTGQIVLAAVAAGIYLALMWWTLAWVRRSDTSNLLE